MQQALYLGLATLFGIDERVRFEAVEIGLA
jgi:hypothetical protein